MKKYVYAAALVAALAAAGAVAVSGGGDARSDDAGSPATTVVTDVVAGGDAGDTDVPTGGVEDEVEPPEADPAPPRLDRSAVLGDLVDAIEARAEELGERLVDLDSRRASGGDITEGVANLVDDVTGLGEVIVTGVAITPEALEAVPDLREVHLGLIARLDRVHSAAASLDPSADDTTWATDSSDVLDALGLLVAFASLDG